MAWLECRGTLEFDAGIDTATLLAHLAQSLRGVEARDVRLSENSVSFRGGFFRAVDNWNILGPFGNGTLITDDARLDVQYSLGIRQLVFAATVLVGLVAASASFNADSRIVLPFLPFAWLWLVGGNLMIGLPRFRRFLRDAIDSVPAA